MDWAGVVGGLGIGSLVTSFATNIMTQRATINQRWFQEKREAYLGLLGALHDAAVKPSDAHSKAYALWQTRCHLFGSDMVAKYAQRIVDTNDGPRKERDEAFDRLIEAMKLDLKG